MNNNMNFEEVCKSFSSDEKTDINIEFLEGKRRKPHTGTIYPHKKKKKEARFSNLTFA